MARNKSAQEFLSKLDLLPEEEASLKKIKKILNSITEFYGFTGIQPPLFDEYRPYIPFFRSKLFYERPPLICRTKSGEEILFHPSGVLSSLRMYNFYNMVERPHPVKLVYQGDGFYVAKKDSDAFLSDVLRGGKNLVIKRNHEFGFVIVGEDSPVAETEIIQIAWKALEKMGFGDNLQLRLNATGCRECRPVFRSHFSIYLRSRIKKICQNCRKNFKHVPTLTLGCSEEKCCMVLANAPQILDFLCEQCKKHLRVLLEFLEELRIPYFLDPRFFRDGSWYNTFVFEIVDRDEKESYQKNKERTIYMEGGRLSKAAELLSGRPLKAVGGSLFLNTLVSVSGLGSVPARKAKIFFVQLGELAKKKSFGILENLRMAGLEVIGSLGHDSIKSQLKLAERENTEITLILGQKEALDGTIIVRETKSGIQETIPQAKLIEFLKARLKNIK